MSNTGAELLYPMYSIDEQLYCVKISSGKNFAASKTIRWEISKPLIIHYPIDITLEVKNGQLTYKSDSKKESLGALDEHSTFSFSVNTTSVTIEKLNWSDLTLEKKNPNAKVVCLQHLAIQTYGTLRVAATSFQKQYDLMAGNLLLANAVEKATGLEFTAIVDGISVVLDNNRIQTLTRGSSLAVSNLDLQDFKISYGLFSWKFRPIDRAFEIFSAPNETALEEQRTVFLIVLIFAIISFLTIGNILYQTWISGKDIEVVENIEPHAIVTVSPSDKIIPESLIQERKIREKINQPSADTKGGGAIRGDGKLPPGGEVNGPVAPAPALGNGLAPAKNGGAPGTLIGKHSDAAPIPKTNQVHPSDMNSNQLKLLQRKSESLKSAFSSVLGYLNKDQAPSGLSMTDPNAKPGERGSQPSGGMIVSPKGTGKGINTLNDQVLVLGQVGRADGKGIVGGTGGSPNGVPGGLGLSTRFKGTGTKDGSGIGGALNGRPFVDIDAPNDSGGYDGSVTGGLEKSEVGRVIHAHSSEIRQCYEMSLLRTPGIVGRLILNFTINLEGRVNNSRIQSATFNSPMLGQCVVQRLQTWNFPKPRGGVLVQVSYPFNFRTLGGAK